jgi:hypothetical protein
MTRSSNKRYHAHTLAAVAAAALKVVPRGRRRETATVGS